MVEKIFKSRPQTGSLYFFGVQNFVCGTAVRPVGIMQIKERNEEGMAARCTLGKERDCS